LMALFANLIMGFYGKAFLRGGPVLILLVLATVINSTVAPIGQAIASLDRMWWGFGLNLIWGAALLAMASFLAPRHGALGLSTAFLGSYLVHAIAVTTYVRMHAFPTR